MEKLRARLELPLLQRGVFFSLLSILVLLPLSLVWSGVSLLRSLRREKKAFRELDDVSVVSIGNVSVGGTGKSPLLRAFARLAFQDEYDVAVVTRGYAASGHASEQVLRVHPDLWTNDAGLAGKLSDETLEHAWLLAGALSERDALWIAQGLDRAALLDAITQQWRELRRTGAEQQKRRLVVFLDDALQQTAVAVHRDVVVWDPESVIQAPRLCLPCGPYRMGIPFGRLWRLSLPTADVVAWSRLRQSGDDALFQNALVGAARLLGLTESLSGQSQVIARERFHLARLSVSEEQTLFELIPESGAGLTENIRLLCGIARPQRFLTSVEEFFTNQQMRRSIVSFTAVADHGPLNHEGLRNVLAGDSVVMTFKDVCRWWHLPDVTAAARAGRVFVLCLDVDILNRDQAELPATFAQLLQFHRETG